MTVGVVVMPPVIVIVVCKYALFVSSVWVGDASGSMIPVPTYNFFAIAKPPDTTEPATVVLEASVVSCRFAMLPTYSCLAIPTPPANFAEAEVVLVAAVVSWKSAFIWFPSVNPFTPSNRAISERLAAPAP